MNSVLVATNLISALFILVISLGLLQVPKEALGAALKSFLSTSLLQSA